MSGGAVLRSCPPPGRLAHMDWRKAHSTLCVLNVVLSYVAAL